MTTLAESVQNAANRLDAAVAALTALRDPLAAQLAAAVANAVNAANAVVNRPTQRPIYIDPVAGLETNPGTLAEPRKDIDAVLATLTTQYTIIYLLGDVTIKKRHTTFSSIIFYGIQRAANAVGFVLSDRQVSFIGVAENSPRATGETDCSGLTIYGYNFQSGSISFRLPEQPAGNTLKSHISNNTGAAITAIGANVTVAGPAAGSLFGSLGNQVSVFFSGALAAGAAGHLFEGVAANANPNNLFGYNTNVTAA